MKHALKIPSLQSLSVEGSFTKEEEQEALRALKDNLTLTYLEVSGYFFAASLEPSNGHGSSLLLAKISASFFH